ncbi:MAG: Fe-S cluster assembly protein SufD, partial [Actinobacteria bacterium]|nr:Fe-S cluster assembly protein SufD [Actinomycetota bacterium]
MSTLTTNYLAPTGREEAWRFTPLARVGGLLDASTAIESVASLRITNAAPQIKLTVKSAQDLPAISISDDLA